MDYVCKTCGQERVRRRVQMCAQCKKTIQQIHESHRLKGDGYEKHVYRSHRAQDR